MSEQRRFTETPDGWWRDSETGLEWSPTAPEQMSHAEAVAWCEGVGGRLPTIHELVGVVDYDCYDPATELLDTRSYNYWSASTYVPGPGFAWSVDFNGGYVGADGKTSDSSVRAVRGGS